MKSSLFIEPADVGLTSFSLICCCVSGNKTLWHGYHKNCNSVSSVLFLMFLALPTSVLISLYTWE